MAKVTEMQNRLTEAHARVSESSKRLQESESERRKLEFSLQQAQVCVGHCTVVHNCFACECARETSTII